jgi:hypothetical protein
VPGFTEIENYEPPNEGFRIVLGRFMAKPEPKPHAEEPRDEDAEEQDG